jgi:hypothetical protein
MGNVGVMTGIGISTTLSNKMVVSKDSVPI